MLGLSLGLSSARRGGVDALLASMRLSNATDLLAIDFRSETMRIKDSATPANAYAGALVNKLTYSGSTKYRRNGAGVLVPATDILPEYNIAGANIGHRLEQQDVNRLLWSSDLSNAAWSRISMPTAPEAADDPAGGMTAWTLTDDQAGDFSYISQSAAVTANTATHQIRFRLKKALAASTAIPGLSIYLNGGTSVSAFPRVDPYTGGAAGGAVVTDEGGWWGVRCPITNNGTNTTLVVNIAPAVRTTIGGADSVAAVGSNTFWCPQAGDNFVASSPIVTTTAQVTRAADSLSLDGSLFPLPSSGGMMVVDWTPFAGATIGGIGVMATSVPTNNRVDIRNNPTYSIISSGGVAQASLIGSDLRGTRHKTALRWRTNSARLAVNGALVAAEDTSVTLPVSLGKLWFALDASPTLNNPQAHIRSFVVVPGTDFANADIIAASTL